MNFSEIKLNVLCESSRVFEKNYLCRSGMNFRINDKSFYIAGASFGKDERLAKIKSKYECLERFYGHYYRCLSSLTSKIPVYNLCGDIIKDNVSMDEICVGGINTGDANGLACHTNFEKSLFHGVYEIIERHLLALWWYKGEYINPVEREIFGNVTFTSFCLSNFDLPFSIVTAHDKKNKIFLCGGALRSTWEEARNHAKSEAMMLYECVFRQIGEKEWTCHNPNALLKTQSFKGELEFFRKKYADSLIRKSNKVISYSNYSTDDIFESISLKKEDIYLSVIHSEIDCVVTRVNSGKLYGIKDHELIAKKTKIPQDPFC